VAVFDFFVGLYVNIVSAACQCYSIVDGIMM